MKYFFILGTNRAMSLAELTTVLPEAKNGETLNSSVFVVDLKEELDARGLIKRLGGIIKIGIFESEAPMYSGKALKIIEGMLKPKKEGKFKYGISNYAKFASPKKDKILAMEIKKYLKTKEASCRWVTGKEKTLSSVIVGQNLMKDNGIEIVLAGDYKKCLVGKTLAVQDYKGLSARDYGRPERDDLSGMLPPKLAQIMINLSKTGEEEFLLDPFCGSGTVVMEAMLMGYKNILGSDLSQKAVDDSINNVEWTKKKFNLEANTKVFHSDVRFLLNGIERDSLGGVVTEPYLGPQRGEVKQDKVKKELDDLYSKAIKVIEKLLKPKGRLVMVWPVRVLKDKKLFLNPDIGKLSKVKVLDGKIFDSNKNYFSHRNTIVYGREGQKVWREVVVLEKD